LNSAIIINIIKYFIRQTNINVREISPKIDIVVTPYFPILFLTQESFVQNI